MRSVRRIDQCNNHEAQINRNVQQSESGMRVIGKRRDSHKPWHHFDLPLIGPAEIYRCKPAIQSYCRDTFPGGSSHCMNHVWTARSVAACPNITWNEIEIHRDMMGLCDIDVQCKLFQVVGKIHAEICTSLKVTLQNLRIVRVLLPKHAQSCIVSYYTHLQSRGFGVNEISLVQKQEHFFSCCLAKTSF